MNPVRADLMRIVAIIANLLMIAVIAFIASQAYGRDSYVALLFIIAPVLSIIALLRLPDAETRMLQQAVTKARLRRELADLGVTAESGEGGA